MLNRRLGIASLALLLFVVAVLFVNIPAVQSKSSEKKIVLTLNLPIPPIHSRWQNALSPWCQEVTKRTNGRVEIKPYFAQALSTMAENYDSVVKGVADMGECGIGMKPGRLPLIEQLQYLVTPSLTMKNQSKMLTQMYSEFPELRDEFKESKLLFVHMNKPMKIATAKKKIDKVDDLKNLKMCVIGSGLVVEKFKALGMSTVFLPMSDIYMSLERGVVDGSHTDYMLFISRKWGDVLKNMVPVTISESGFYVAMNQKKWNSLPEDVQKVFDELSGDYAVTLFDEFWEKDEQESKVKWEKEMQGETHELSPEELKKLDDLIVPLNIKFVEEAEKKGLKLAPLYKRFNELEKQYAGKP